MNLWSWLGAQTDYGASASPNQCHSLPLLSPTGNCAELTAKAKLSGRPSRGRELRIVAGLGKTAEEGLASSPHLLASPDLLFLFHWSLLCSLVEWESHRIGS